MFYNPCVLTFNISTLGGCPWTSPNIVLPEMKYSALMNCWAPKPPPPCTPTPRNEGRTLFGRVPPSLMVCPWFCHFPLVSFMMPEKKLFSSKPNQTKLVPKMNHLGVVSLKQVDAYVHVCCLTMGTLPTIAMSHFLKTQTWVVSRWMCHCVW